jgi:hypothetical protein
VKVGRGLGHWQARNCRRCGHANHELKSSQPFPISIRPNRAKFEAVAHNMVCEQVALCALLPADAGIIMVNWGVSGVAGMFVRVA